MENIKETYCIIIQYNIYVIFDIYAVVVLMSRVKVKVDNQKETDRYLMIRESCVFCSSLVLLFWKKIRFFLSFLILQLVSHLLLSEWCVCGLL